MSIQKTQSAMKRLTTGPAASIKIVKEVMITDVDDFCCFLWRDGEVIFPTKEDLEKIPK